jgi:succinate dehydrogenase / fumarate reductase cytochrome b subunit
VSSQPSATTASPSALVRSRLASFLAIFPLGVWTFIHVWNNLAAFRAADDQGASWQAAVTEYPHPIAQLLTGIVVLLPLALHTAWGIGRLLTSRPNNLRYRHFANLKYLLQRLAAVGVLLFLGAHLWLALLRPRLVEGHREWFGDAVVDGKLVHGIAWEMRHHTPTLVVYLLGTLGVAFHLANGVETMAMGWGIATSRRGLKRVEWLSWGVFLSLLAMCWAVIYAMWKNAPPA